MALFPISATLQKAYRDVLSIPAAPAFIDSEEKVIPVAIVADVAGTTAGASSVKITDGTDEALVSTDGKLHVLPDLLSSDRTYIASARSVNMAAINTVYTLYTVTTGKSLYITSLMVYNDNGGNIKIGDALTAAFATNEDDALYLNGTAAGTSSHVITLPVPLKIDTSLQVTTTTTGNCFVGFVGYEA